jgi:hypothetical protein
MVEGGGVGRKDFILLWLCLYIVSRKGRLFFSEIVAAVPYYAALLPTQVKILGVKLTIS